MHHLPRNQRFFLRTFSIQPPTEPAKQPQISHLEQQKLETPIPAVPSSSSWLSPWISQVYVSFCIFVLVHQDHYQPRFWNIAYYAILQETQQFLRLISALCVFTSACLYEWNIYKAWIFASSFPSVCDLGGQCSHQSGAHESIQGKIDAWDNFESRKTFGCLVLPCMCCPVGLVGLCCLCAPAVSPRRLSGFLRSSVLVRVLLFPLLSALLCCGSCLCPVCLPSPASGLVCALVQPAPWCAGTSL